MTRRRRRATPIRHDTAHLIFRSAAHRLDRRRSADRPQHSRAPSNTSEAATTRPSQRTFAGARSLANLLAQVDANARGQAPDDKLLEVWGWRVDAYLPLILALDAKPQPALVSASPVTTTPAKPTQPGPHRKITTDDERIDGRPVLLADGRLSVTVVRTVRVETKISFADPLWAAAIAAVNA